MNINNKEDSKGYQLSNVVNRDFKNKVRIWVMSNNRGVEMNFKFLSKNSIRSIMSCLVFFLRNNFMPGFFKFGALYIIFS